MGVWVQTADAGTLTSVVACVVCLPSRVSSLKSLLSATNCTNGPGVMFDGMTALV